MKKNNKTIQLDDERITILELQKFIRKYLEMNLNNFNLDTPLRVYIDTNQTIVKVEGCEVALNWQSYDFESRDILLTQVMSVSELCKFIDDYERLVYSWFN